MSEPAPTPHEARAALVEASSHASRVRRADRHFGWVLAVFAPTWVGEITVTALWRSPWSLVAEVGIVAAGCGLIIWLGIRIRAYSRSGIGWFGGSIVAFFVLYYAITTLSFVIGWVGQQHAVINAGVSVIPLIVGAVVLLRR